MAHADSGLSDMLGVRADLAARPSVDRDSQELLGNDTCPWESCPGRPFTPQRGSLTARHRSPAQDLGVQLRSQLSQMLPAPSSP